MPTPQQAATRTRVPPPRHKMALLTWPGAWALITLILWALGPAMATWPLPLRTLAISALMVVGLTWAVIPFLTRSFAGWLAATPQPAMRQHRHGAASPAVSSQRRSPRRYASTCAPAVTS
jgi:antibiotic biosynthesis monooxygenase (ABM) superfamily enzyme